MTVRPIFLGGQREPRDAGISGRRPGATLLRVVPWLLLALLLLAGGCEEPTAVNQPPYIAIVAIITAPNGTAIGDEYTYRVTEVSGTIPIDEAFHVAPHDTVIVPVKPATYKVTLRGVPPQCGVQDGTDLYVLVPEGANTAIVRYLISCESLITVTTATDGYNPDASYIYRVTGPAGERVGIVEANDTLRLDGLGPGDYTVGLSHVASNCVVTSDGGPTRRLVLADTGGTRLDFRVVCSDEAKRPHLLFFAGSYHDGTSGFMFRAADPDGDIERYMWDITDCQGKSVLPGGGRLRRGLSQDRTAGLDTITVFGAVEPGLPDNAMVGRCTSLRVADELGNTTPVVEQPIPEGQPAGPAADLFDARFATTAALVTDLHTADPDYAGVFAAALLRDGVLFPADGQPDLGVYNAAGYEDLTLPTVPLGGSRPPYYDYYAVIVYLFDRFGNFTRLVDTDLFN